MEASFLEALIEWQQQGRRIVKIELGEVSSKNYVGVWIYDIELSSGAYVDSVDALNSIDLKANAIDLYKQMINDLEGK